jgi:hypothetical protein
LILVPLIDLKFLNELAAGDAGTSNRRHQGLRSKAASPRWVAEALKLEHSDMSGRMDEEGFVFVVDRVLRARCVRYFAGPGEINNEIFCDG